MGHSRSRRSKKRKKERKRKRRRRRRRRRKTKPIGRRAKLQNPALNQFLPRKIKSLNLRAPRAQWILLAARNESDQPINRNLRIPLLLPQKSRRQSPLQRFKLLQRLLHPRRISAHKKS